MAQTKEQKVALNKKWKKNNPDKIAAISKKHYEKNHLKIKAGQKKYRENNHDEIMVQQKEWARNNPEKIAAKRRKCKYGITDEQYKNLLSKQRGVCTLCEGVDNNALCVDHDHSTGKIRGLLCGNCNRALGMVKENKNTLQNMIKYLKKHND